MKILPPGVGTALRSQESLPRSLVTTGKNGKKW